MGKLGINLNLMDQLVFYGSYHQHPGNQLIHFFFVPLIMWGSGVLLAYSGPLSDKLDLPSLLSFLPPIIAQGYVINLAFIGFSFYAIYYTILEPFAGLSWTLLSGVPAMWTYNMLQQHAYSYAWAIGLGAHFVGWFMQVKVGHSMIEHKRPALTDSFFQSVVTAGLFAWIEGLFFLGYRPKLQAELKRRIQEATIESSAANTPGKEPLLSAENPIADKQ